MKRSEELLEILCWGVILLVPFLLGGLTVWVLL